MLKTLNVNLCEKFDLKITSFEKLWTEIALVDNTYIFFFVWADLVISAVLLSQFTMSSLRAAKPSVPFGGWYKEQEASM